MLRRLRRTIWLIVIVIIVLFALSIDARAIDNERGSIDVTHASDGYFNVLFPQSQSRTNKMKIGMSFDKQTVFFDYTAGDLSTYAFIYGDGLYKITLYQNVEGTLYRKVSSLQIDVHLDFWLSPFLVSTKEVTFDNDDIVAQTAKDICCGLINPCDKVIAIHRYINKHIVYDKELAKEIKAGLVTHYEPVAVDVLITQKGICYDYAVLFAAMCRSQQIPCVIQKGDYKGSYHAWNKVYIDGTWYDIDSSTVISKDFLSYVRYINSAEIQSEYQTKNLV